MMPSWIPPPPPSRPPARQKVNGYYYARITPRGPVKKRKVCRAMLPRSCGVIFIDLTFKKEITMKDVVIVMMHAFLVILECIYSYHKGLLLGGKYYFFQLPPVGYLV